MAIAWAGKVHTAKRVVSQIYERHLRSPFTRDELKAYPATFASSTWDDISLIGYFRHKPDEVFNFWLGSDTAALPSTQLVRVVTAGTGAKSMHSALGSFPATDGVPKGLAPTVTAQRVAGLLMSFELWNPNSTLGNNFGGGYEIATLTPEGFRKQQGSLYAFWSARVDSNGAIESIGLDQALKFSYKDDLKFIRPLFDRDANGKLQNSLYILSSIHHDNTKLHVSRPPELPFIEPKHPVVHIVNILPPSNLGRWCIVEFPENTSTFLAIEELPKQLYIAYSEAFISKLREEVEARRLTQEPATATAPPCSLD